MDKNSEELDKKIKDEEVKFEHEIEQASQDCLKDIDSLCESEITHIRNEGELFEKEIHEKALKIDASLQPTETENNNNKNNKQKKSKLFKNGKNSID